VIQYAYKELFSIGTKVRVGDGAFLMKFKETWKYHHKLETEQLDYAGRTAIVKKVGFYHGGDVVYELTDIPGVWLEPCLSAAQEPQPDVGRQMRQP
jgi:hypothetical protein